MRKKNKSLVDEMREEVKQLAGQLRQFQSQNRPPAPVSSTPKEPPQLTRNTSPTPNPPREERSSEESSDGEDTESQAPDVQETMSIKNTGTQAESNDNTMKLIKNYIDNQIKALAERIQEIEIKVDAIALQPQDPHIPVPTQGSSFSSGSQHSNGQHQCPVVQCGSTNYHSGPRHSPAL